MFQYKSIAVTWMLLPLFKRGLWSSKEVSGIVAVAKMDVLSRAPPPLLLPPMPPYRGLLDLEVYIESAKWLNVHTHMLHITVEILEWWRPPIVRKEGPRALATATN